MKRFFTARVWKEGRWFIAQCAEVDVASHGRTERQALKNLREALELYFEQPTATVPPKVANIEVEVGGGCAVAGGTRRSAPGEGLLVHEPLFCLLTRNHTAIVLTQHPIREAGGARARPWYNSTSMEHRHG